MNSGIKAITRAKNNRNIVKDVIYEMSEQQFEGWIRSFGIEVRLKGLTPRHRWLILGMMLASGIPIRLVQEEGEWREQLAWVEAKCLMCGEYFPLVLNVNGVCPKCTGMMFE